MRNGRSFFSTLLPCTVVLLTASCSAFSDDGATDEGTPAAGASGAGGSSGQGGSAGASGKGGSAGQGGSSDQGGSAGQGGSGQAGSGPNAGAAGVGGAPVAGGAGAAGADAAGQGGDAGTGGSGAGAGGSSAGSGGSSAGSGGSGAGTGGSGAGAGGSGAGAGGSAGSGGGPASAVCTSASKEGLWGAPTKTFTLPAKNKDGGLYYPDVQKSFPEVDWTTLERLYIPADTYRYIQIKNLPKRSADKPLVITNQGGQVRVGGGGFIQYNMAIGGGSGWVLTGRYDPISKTGDEKFPGHKGCKYANTTGTYGIELNDNYESGSLLGVGSGATAFEIEFVEAHRADFAGMLIKSDDDGGATMSNVRIHDNYIHDVLSEGFYIGSTQAQPQHKFVGLKIYNNRVLRTGTEIVQTGQIGDGCEIFNNVFLGGAMDWRAPFQGFQDGAQQYSPREGSSEVHHNLVIGGADVLINFIFGVVDGDVHKASDTILFRKNYYAHGRNVVAYINAKTDNTTRFRFEENVFGTMKFSYDEVHPDKKELPHLFTVANSGNPIEFVNNTWMGPKALTSKVAGGDGQSGNVTATGNKNADVAPVAFANSGLPADFDYGRLTFWTHTYGIDDKKGQAVPYKQGDHVMHDSVLYVCLKDHTPDAAAAPEAEAPPKHPDLWKPLPPLPDDVRVSASSPYAGMGLLDTVE